MILGKAIYNILSNHVGLTALVGLRIYPVTAAQLDTFPYVVFNVQRHDPVNRMNGRARMDQVYLEVSGYAKTYDDADAVAIQIRNALDRATPGTYASVGIATILFENTSDSYDDPEDVYSMPMEYKINLHTGQS